jgi:hypothetical protein
LVGQEEDIVIGQKAFEFVAPWRGMTKHELRIVISNGPKIPVLQVGTVNQTTELSSHVVSRIANRSHVSPIILALLKQLDVTNSKEVMPK